MASECPHTTDSHLVEATRTHCHDSSPRMIGSHVSYLKMIGELKSELEQISTEVVKVQKECCHHVDESTLDDKGGGLETSLKELESQNDRLQEALKTETLLKDTALTVSQSNNENLKCQIHQLSAMLMERDKQIQYLTTVVNHHPVRMQLKQSPHNVIVCGSQTSAATTTHDCCGSTQRIADMEKRIETLSKELDKSQRQEHFQQTELRKLNKELIESKRINGELVTRAQRLAGVLKKQESHHYDMASRNDDLEKNCENYAKKLRAAHAQMSLINERFQMMEKSQAENTMERNLLRDEVLALKEKEAMVVGRHRSLQEQMVKLEQELYAAHDVIKEQRTIMERSESAHSDMLRRVKDENGDVKRKLKSLCEDHKRLKEDHEKEKEIVKQYETILDSYRKWKDDQVKAEAQIREQLNKHAELMQLQNEEKKKFQEEFHNLYRDYLILESELEKARKDAFKQQPVYAHTCTAAAGFSERALAERIQLIRQATLRVSEQNSYLQAHVQAKQLSQCVTRSTSPQNSNEAASEEKT